MSRGLPRPRVVTFDFDGTLLDTAGFVPQVITQVCRAAADLLRLDVALVRAANAEEWAAFWPTAEPAWAAGSLTGRDMIEEVWRRSLRRCGCQDGDILRSVIEVQSALNTTSAWLFPEAQGVVASLRDAGIGIALVTNGAADTQRGWLDALGINDWFDLIVVSAEVGAVKPDSAIFGRVLDSSAVSSAEVWHVGDNLRTDVAGAAGAGMAAVWVNRRGELCDQGPVPDAEISALDGLLKLLQDTE